MLFQTFYESIKTAVEKINDLNTGITRNFLNEINAIQENSDDDDIHRMTGLTVLFEGFYRFLPEGSALKSKLLAIRVERWKNHLGTPTIQFLISYQADIDKILQQFKLGDSAEFVLSREKPQDMTVDTVNNIIIDKDAISNVPMPEQKETAGILIKTHNQSGGFTLPPDTYSQKFIEYAAQATAKSGRALEIGAAFGTATLKALDKGASIDCNDIDPQNLAVVSQRYSSTLEDKKDENTESGKLRLLPGAFPDELAGLPSNSYKAILACRVLHFFPGALIDRSVKRMADLLEPGGKLYIVCETPYQKNWHKFLPEYERRVVEGVEWPGEMTNPAQFESSGRASLLPKFMHQLSKNELIRSIERAGDLKLEECSYISRADQFSEELLLDGRESVGLVAVKEMRSKL